jgi:hypothetical protein
MRNIIFRGRENQAVLGVSFDGAFSLSDFDYITVEVGDQVYSSQDGDITFDDVAVYIDIASDTDLPDDGRHHITLIGYNADYPLGYVLVHPGYGIDELQIATID